MLWFLGTAITEIKYYKQQYYTFLQDEFGSTVSLQRRPGVWVPSLEKDNYFRDGKKRIGMSSYTKKYFF